MPQERNFRVRENSYFSSKDISVERSSDESFFTGLSVKDLVVSVAIALVLSLTLLPAWNAYGVEDVPYLHFFNNLFVSEAITVVFSFLALLFFMLYLLRSRRSPIVNRKNTFISNIVPLEWDARSIAMGALIIFLLWSPVVLEQYPVEVSFDTINQLYQYDTPAPTVYSTTGQIFDAEYIDHHPVFDTLLYGAFWSIGGFLGSREIGLLLFSVLQTFCMATVFSVTCCYAARLGVNWSYRTAGFLFMVLFPPFSHYATSMLKDSTFVCFFLLFVCLYMEIVRTKGKAFFSKRFCAGFFVVACLCILSKKTGFYVILPSIAVAAVAYKGVRNKLLFNLVVTFTVCSILIPSVLYPVLGGVEPGGKGEMLAPFVQQTVAVEKEYHDLDSSQKAAVNRVIDLEKAEENFNHHLTDDVKYCMKLDANQSDYKSYFSVWLVQGFRHPVSYLKTWLSCTAPLYIPMTRAKYYISINEKGAELFSDVAKSVGNSFDFDGVKRPKCLDEFSASLRNFYLCQLPAVPVVDFVLDTGFYGGWLPVLCLVVVIYRSRREAVAFVPIIISLCLLMICPVADTRYALPLLCSAFLMLAWTLYVTTKTNFSK